MTEEELIETAEILMGSENLPASIEILRAFVKQQCDEILHNIQMDAAGIEGRLKKISGEIGGNTIKIHAITLETGEIFVSEQLHNQVTESYLKTQKN